MATNSQNRTTSHTPTVDITTHVTEGPASEIVSLISGQGDPLVLLPSLGRGAEDFDPLVDQLSEAFSVIRPQPRGFNEDAALSTNVDMHDLAADVAAVLDDTIERPAVVLGHAFGSQPARMLSVDRPDLVSGLILAAASAGKLPEGSTEKPYSRLREEIDGAGNYDLSDSERVRCLKAAFFAPTSDPLVWMEGWSRLAHEIQSHARRSTPIDAYFAGGGVPILDLQAEHDKVVIPKIYKAFLGDRVEECTVPDAGHALLPENPNFVVECIREFAQKLQRPVRPSA